jgi:hypothetical protein
VPSIPEYITVTDAAGAAVAFLAPEADGVTAEISAELNGQCQIVIKLPTTAAKASELIPERHILAGGREFTILGPATEERSRDKRKTWLQITAPESRPPQTYPTVANDAEPAPVWGTVSILASDLGQGGYSPGSGGSALYRLLSGSGWTVGTVDVTGTFDLETLRITLLENIQKAQERWGGYLVWDSVAKTVSLRSETAWQPGTGVRIEYAKNLKGVTREMDSDLVTRLYPFGQDALSIASVNGGSIYIEDHHYSAAVYEGIYENQEIDDPAQLLAKAQAVIARLSEPRVSYRVSMADLSALPEYAHETFALGDIVRVIDPEVVRRLITADDISAAWGSSPGQPTWDPDCDLDGNGTIWLGDLNVLATTGGKVWVASQRGVDLRIVRYTYDVFQPWQATLEVGQPTQTLAAMIAGTVQAANFVKQSLRPNPGTGNLLRGFVNTFATTINSASGKLMWSDDTLQAIEVNGAGVETGKRVRITPGGVGISTDGGATFVTAMTGQGVLANTVIVSDLYALSSDDGYTQVKGDGLHVFDAALQERVHVGRWLVSSLEHYGIRIFSASGTILLDDQGILQSWQEGRADNIDVGYPMILNVYLPAETRVIKRGLLRFRPLAFRAYETGAASGGGATATSSSGGGTTATSTSGGGTTATSTSGGGSTVTSLTASLWDYTAWVPDAVTDAGSHNHGGATGSAGSHNHGITPGIWLAVSSNGSSVTGYQGWLQASDHFHSLSIDGSHSHVLEANHRHSVTIGDHAHSVTILGHTHDVTITPHSHTVVVPSHVHSVVYGIYVGPTPGSISVQINGVDRTSALGGPWVTDQASIDIAPYLQAGQWNTVSLGSFGLGRVDASVFVQIFMGV